jgi:hypothetical protein
MYVAVKTRYDLLADRCNVYRPIKGNKLIATNTGNKIISYVLHGDLALT